MPSPYPWHYTLRWPLYFHWPSVRNHDRLQSAPDRHQFGGEMPDDIRLLFCGDIMVQPGDRIPELHPVLCSLIRSADLFIGNCESPLGRHVPNPRARYRFRFNMPKVNLESILQQTGLPANQWLLSMANNHTGDQGYHACLETFDLLNEIGITPLGRYDSQKPPVCCVSVKNLRIGFAAWTEWMNCEIFPRHDPGAFRGVHIRGCDWENLRSSVGIDYLIGIPHWEFEFQHFPRRETRSLASALINQSRMDFVVGIHTHTLQPIEWFSHGICAYNLGNFCGLGQAWPVKLISLLEVRLRTNTLMEQLVSYKMHYFYQQHDGSKVSIIPIDLAPQKVKERLSRRIAAIFHHES